MTRTNIDIDDDLVGEVMRRYDVRTKREAVDLALRRLVGVPLTRDFLLDLRGLGWGGDLDELRSADPIEKTRGHGTARWRSAFGAAAEASEAWSTA